jgi:hypothetical protein
MALIAEIIFAVAVFAFFFWMLVTSSAARSEDDVIDATDARQVGNLIGLLGGSVADAAVAQYALRRFEEEHGRKATWRDVGLVGGMMKR